jgi:hypothetical protein
MLVACQPKTAALAPTTPTPPVARVEPPIAAPATPPAVVEPVAVDASDDRRCEPGVAPLERRAGDLVIHAPPDPPAEAHFLGRLRTHTEGSLAIGNVRTWVGPHVPGFVPPAIDKAELFLLERDGDDWIALYREPYGEGACSHDLDAICRYVIKGFRECEPIYTLELRELMSRPTYLEVHDVRARDGILYFNEACQSYAKQVRGKCSSLVAVDTKTGKLVWRSKPLVSNNRFLVLDRYIITGYGFTAEPDALFVLRRSDGTVVQKIALPKSHENLVIEGDRLVVKMYEGTRVFEMRGFDGDAPKLVRVADAK